MSFCRRNTSSGLRRRRRLAFLGCVALKRRGRGGSIQRLYRALVEPTGRPLLRAVIRATPVIVAVIFATAVLSSMGWLDRFESAGLDALNILQSPRDPSHVLLIGITDQDYREFFDETSPLDPTRLYEIIEAIAAGRPSLIGIDVDTSADVFRRFKTPPDWPPIVWGQDFEQVGEGVKTAPVLAGQPLRDTDRAGIAALPEDADGIVRRYLREFPTETGTAPALPWEIVQTAATLGMDDFREVTAESRRGHAEKPLLLNFSGERYSFNPLSVRFVLQAARSAGWKQRGPLVGKVVVLGGCYRAARDTHITPVGKMSGLQLMAQAVESELGGGIRAFNHALEILFDLVCGVLLVIIHHRFRLGTALLLSLIAIPVFCLLGSFVAFSTMARWFNFAPVILGVLIHQLYDHARQYAKMHAQLTSHA